MIQISLPRPVRAGHTCTYVCCILSSYFGYTSLTPSTLNHQSQQNRKKHVFNIPAQTEMVKTHVTHNKQNPHLYLAGCRIRFPNCIAQNTKLKPGCANSFFFPYQPTFHGVLFPSSNTVASDVQIRSSASTKEYRWILQEYGLRLCGISQVRIHVKRRRCGQG